MDTPALFSSGTIPAGGTVATGVGAGSPPFSIQLNSTNASRAISLSMDGGAHFVTMTPTATVAGAILLNYNGPIGQVLFAGASGDTYDIE
jgi:hypothetical protein